MQSSKSWWKQRYGNGRVLSSNEEVENGIQNPTGILYVGNVPSVSLKVKEPLYALVM